MTWGQLLSTRRVGCTQTHMCGQVRQVASLSAGKGLPPCCRSVIALIVSDKSATLPSGRRHGRWCHLIRRRATLPCCGCPFSLVPSHSSQKKVHPATDWQPNINDCTNQRPTDRLIYSHIPSAQAFSAVLATNYRNDDGGSVWRRTWSTLVE